MTCSQSYCAVSYNLFVSMCARRLVSASLHEFGSVSVAFTNKAHYRRSFLLWMLERHYNRLSFHNSREDQLICVCTGCFINPSGISEVCSSRAKSHTGDESMSVKRVHIQVLNLPYKCSICPPLVTQQTYRLVRGPQSQAMIPAYLFVLRHTNSQFPRIFYTSLLLFRPLVVLYDTWFENHIALLQLTGF
jgi:hypothetical protein